MQKNLYEVRCKIIW